MIRLILFIILPYCAVSQEATIRGNAFWKYNEYVGNRADAGSAVLLFPSDSISGFRSTTCDLQGNFSFNNLQPGSYLVVIKSKNTNSDGVYNFQQLLSPGLEKYLGFTLRDINSKIVDSVISLQSLTLNELAKPVKMYTRPWRKQQDLVAKYRATMQSLLYDLFLGMPTSPTVDALELKNKVSQKVYIQEVTVAKNDSKSVVADFGITTYR